MKKRNWEWWKLSRVNAQVCRVCDSVQQIIYGYCLEQVKFGAEKFMSTAQE
jgi:hypothetical protein